MLACSPTTDCSARSRSKSNSSGCGCASSGISQSGFLAMALSSAALLSLLRITPEVARGAPWQTRVQRGASEGQREVEPEDIALRAVLRVDVERVAEIDADRAEIVTDERADRERLEAIAGRVADAGEIRRRAAAVERVVLDLIDPESHDAAGPFAEALLHGVVDGHDVAGLVAQARREVLVLGLDVEFEVGGRHEIAVEVADRRRRAEGPGMVGDVDGGVLRPGAVAEIDRHVDAEEEIGRDVPGQDRRIDDGVVEPGAKIVAADEAVDLKVDQRLRDEGAVLCAEDVPGR